MDSNPTTFLLIRHAQTAWNKEQRHTGSVEVELSDKAERQIAKLTQTLLTLPITAIYSSPLSRCKLTIAAFAHHQHLTPIIDERLIERSLGDWEGKHPEELLPLHPGYEFPYSAYEGTFHIKDAETLEDLEKRIREFLHEAHSNNPGKTVAVITHSGVIWTVLHRIVTNKPAERFWPENCSITVVESQGNHYLLKDSHIPL